MKLEAKEEGRREQLLEATRRLILATGSLNISLNDIADELSVSRSLVYVYFDSVAQIIDELFAEEAEAIDRAIVRLINDDSSFRERLTRLFAAYLDHLATGGQLGYLVLRERNQDNPLSAANSRKFRRILRNLSRHAVDALALRPREAFVLLELIAAIPESLARMVRSGKLEIEIAQETSAMLIGSAIDAYEVH
ncbi:TetR/AcrR family transcriptional regulator [Parerythrobacter lacustris]|uniref:TetR/AcrR family transcriptional regulator n=1 Tax=Parerythrobacter lacustris TaxID=2969984 RepID=A0ABT1XQK0_9SPHN|nr:TetR/AcrR family transcriptional regulator [Parerythrobacter lacustris]MCR2833512.1 TetR/AcrR family transcriptional regulator [Parerythrobacter lacustris]